MESKKNCSILQTCIVCFSIVKKMNYLKRMSVLGMINELSVVLNAREKNDLKTGRIVLIENARINW